MKTDVYFATKDNGMIVAYMNEKKQEVFLSVSRYKFAPFFQNLLVFNDDFPIENIIEKGFGYTIINKKEMDKDKCNALYNKFLEIYKKSN